ncbi:MAG: toll/interleukin-1 receptor domain-containing protein [Verrucomicrobia bacterium]|nr:toll/interleukin-1 receptor domain-containing protein [Verrucomicrobiota bacterium]
MKEYTYYAFISYSRKDEKWAKWLQKKLETYRLPSALCRESDGKVPNYTRPVFRDLTFSRFMAFSRNRERSVLCENQPAKNLSPGGGPGGKAAHAFGRG